MCVCVCVCVCVIERGRERGRVIEIEIEYIYRDKYIERVIEQERDKEERSTPLIFLLPRHPVYFSGILPNI